MDRASPIFCLSLTAAFALAAISGCTSHGAQRPGTSHPHRSMTEILAKANDATSFAPLARYIGVNVPIQSSEVVLRSPGFVLEGYGEIGSVEIGSIRDGLPIAIGLLSDPTECIDLDRLKSESGARRGEKFNASDLDFSYVFLTHASVTFVSSPQNPKCLGSIQLKRSD